MNRKPSDDWFAFGVRFFFGALLGLFLGIRFGVYFFEFGMACWLLILGSTVLLGLVAGYWGDAFWQGLKYWFWWWS